MGQNAASTIYENKDIYEVLQSASRDPQRKALQRKQISNNVTLDLYNTFAPNCWKPFHSIFIGKMSIVYFF